MSGQELPSLYDKSRTQTVSSSSSNSLFLFRRSHLLQCLLKEQWPARIAIVRFNRKLNQLSVLFLFGNCIADEQAGAGMQFLQTNSVKRSSVLLQLSFLNCRSSLGGEVQALDCSKIRKNQSRNRNLLYRCKDKKIYVSHYSFRRGCPSNVLEYSTPPGQSKRQIKNLFTGIIEFFEQIFIISFMGKSLQSSRQWLVSRKARVRVPGKNSDSEIKLS